MDPRELTHETLVAACAQIPDEVADLVIAMAARVADLEAQVKELTRQLHQNSRNSSQPPSSDGYEKPAPKSRREKSGKPSGGQLGHSGAHLALRNDPDHVVVHSYVEFMAIYAVQLSAYTKSAEEPKLFTSTVGNPRFVGGTPISVPMIQEPRFQAVTGLDTARVFRSRRRV